MTIGGTSLILILGIVNGILVLFQVGSGLHYIHCSFQTHKIAGIILLVTALIHGVLAIMAN